MKSPICLIPLFFLFGCSDEQRYERRKFENYTIEADFGKDSKINGRATYYDLNNKLTNIVNYEDGIKNGYAISYYGNGIAKDSLFFYNGEKHGTHFFFDEKGNLELSSNYFHGIQVGAACIYSKGLLSRYLFTDFTGQDIVACDYISGTNGKVNLVSFHTNPRYIEGTENGRPIYDFLFYTPMPPGLKVEYKLGIKNDANDIPHLDLLKPSSIFIDTILPKPPNGYYYFVQAHVIRERDSINKIFIDEIK